MSDMDRARPPEDALDLELDRAIDALNRDRRPDPDIGSWDALEAAMVLRATQPPEPPDSAFATSLAARLVAADRRPSENGQVHLVRTDPLLAPVRPGWGSVLMSATRAAGACALAGMVAGILVGGIGGRVVMLVSGEMYRREHPHVRIRTESSGRLVGDFTWSGTFELISLGMLFGLIGGLIYFLARRWLPRSTRFEGLLFGVLLLFVAGLAVFSSDNTDFDRFGSPVVNVVMFASLFVLFGMVVSPLSRWSSRLILRQQHTRGIGLTALGWMLALMGGLGLVFVALMVATSVVELLNALVDLGSGDASLSSNLATVAIAGAIVVLPIMRAFGALLDRGLLDAPVNVSTIDAIGRWTLWIAVVAGAMLTLVEIAKIVGLA